MNFNPPASESSRFREDSACQKSLFDKLVDGRASSPATATPSRFHLNPLDSGREICKVAIFSPENRIFLRKKSAAGATYTPPRPIFMAVLHRFFDSLRGLLHRQRPSLLGAMKTALPTSGRAARIGRIEPDQAASSASASSSTTSREGTKGSKEWGSLEVLVQEMTYHISSSKMVFASSTAFCWTPMV